LSLDDGLEIDAKTINKAKYEVEVEVEDEVVVDEALRDIGYEYETKLSDYSKAMAWYPLAANHNDSNAYNNIGCLYHDVYEVSQDYITAMEYYIKALEWFAKHGDRPKEMKKLNKRGIHLREEDKSKSSYEFESCYC
jgi:TPR repeat protein